MNKKKKGLWTRLLEWQSKPLRILAKETVKGIKEGLEKDNDEKDKKD